jgi:hypothetical protein
MDDVVKQWVIDQQIPLHELCQRLYIPFRCHNYSYIYGSATPTGTFGSDFKKAVLRWYETKEFPSIKPSHIKSDPDAVEFLEANKKLFINLSEFNLIYCIDLKNRPIVRLILTEQGDYEKFSSIVQHYFIPTSTYTFYETSNPWRRILD